MVESIHAAWLGVDLHRFSPHRMGDTGRIYRRPVPDHYLRRLRIHWISKAPAWLAGVLQGVLPQSMLVALNVLLPLVLRNLTGWQGLSTETAIELSLQKSYFVFLFAQNFLTVSLSSSITIIAQELLHGPNSALALLAKNLPKASNYFFSYLALQSLTVNASALLQAGSLINWFILAPWADRTPRQKLKRLRNLPEIR